MSKWKMVKLGKIATVQSGFAFKSECFIKNEIPIIKIGNITNESIVANVGVTYPKSFWNLNSEYRINYEDLLIAMSGATIGKVGKYDKKKPALLNQRVGKIAVNRDVAINEFVFYYVKSEKFKRQVINLSAGCAQPNISSKQIESIQIPLPPLDVQHEIAAKLDAVSDLLKLRKQKLTELDKLIESVFYDMFGDPIINSKKWDIVPLIDVIKLQRGFDLPVQNRVKSGNIPVYGSNGVLDFHNEAKVKNGGVITGRSGTIGKVYYTLGDYWPLNTTLFSVDLHNNNIIFLAYMLKYFRLERFCSGTGVPTLNRNVVHKEKVFQIPFKLQNKFASIVQKIEQQKTLVQQSIDETQELFDSLMSKYFDE